MYSWMEQSESSRIMEIRIKTPLCQLQCKHARRQNKTKQNKIKKGIVFRNAHSDRHCFISTCWRTRRKSKLFFFLIIGLNGIGCGGRAWSHVRMCTRKATEALGQLKGKYHRLRHNKWVINKLAADLQKRAQPSVPSLCLWNNTTPRAGKCYGPSLHSHVPMAHVFFYQQVTFENVSA